MIFVALGMLNKSRLLVLVVSFAKYGRNALLLGVTNWNLQVSLRNSPRNYLRVLLALVVLGRTDDCLQLLWLVGLT